jgi:hypothetical protein
VEYKRKKFRQRLNRIEKEVGAKVRQTENILSFVLMPE